MSNPQKYPPYDYTFCPLTDPAEDLRILKITLSANSHEDKVEGQILQLKEGQEYAALSWSWGARDGPTSTMRITHNDQPYDFQISFGLELALRELRRSKVEYIWIDQVCINQSDLAERNNQVRLMAKIYTKANLVYVWLGENSEGDSADGGAAFEFIQTRVLQLKYFDNLVTDDTKHKDWNNMVELMKRVWFSRRWIVQEIALARDAVILCGSNSIKWLEFADAVSLFNDAEAEKRTVTKTIMRGKKEYGFNPRHFGYVPALSATRLVEVTNDLFRRRADHEKVALLSLEQLVSTFTAFNASEPRDTIYAVLAIAKDTVPRTSPGNMKSMVASYKSNIQKKFIEQLSRKIVAKSYPVNYDQPVSDVFVDFVDFAISQSEKTRALDIICRPWAPSPDIELEGLNDDGDAPWRAIFDERVSQRTDNLGKDTLPSWIPSISGAAYGMEPQSKRMVRKNADTLVGVPPQRNYTAAGNVPVTRSLRFEQGITKYSKYQTLNGTHYHSMFVEGFIVDTLENLKSASQKGHIPTDWTKLAKRLTHEDEEWSQLPDMYWRTLVADRGKNGNPPRHYPRVIDHALKSVVPGDAFSTQDAIDHQGSQAVSDVLERVQSVIWNRRLVFTKGQRLGLVPEHAQKGDLIAILYGCSVPVVLRRFTKTKEEVEEETKTKLPRRDKLAARKILETLRAFVAQKKRQREQIQQPQSNNQAVLDRVGQNNAIEDTHNLSSNENSLTAELQEPEQGKPHEAIGGRPRDLDAMSVNSERSLRMPGSWQDSTPPVSRKGTDIVAPGPILPQSIVGMSRTASNISSGGNVTTKPKESLLQSDKYTFYQLIGECYLHGMMNGEAIPMQRSAEDESKQKSAADKMRLIEVRKVTEREREMSKDVYNRELKRAITLPASKPKETEIAPGPIEPELFMRGLFELR